MKIGVLAIQGAIEEHINMVKKCGAEAVWVSTPAKLDEIDGLIIPGGESTTIGKLAKIYDIDKKIIAKVNKGMPIWGTCAGMVYLAKEVINPAKDQNTLKLLDISIKRNASGRQIDSYSGEINFEKAGINNHKSIFIRAPYVSRIGDNVEILGKIDDHIIFVKQDNIMATSFHPELTNDIRFHEYFIKMIEDRSA